MAVAQAQVQAAQANATQVLANFKRYQNLYKKHAATGQEMDRATALKGEAEARLAGAKQQAGAAEKNVEKARAQLAASRAALVQAQVTLSYTTIQAPYSGIVARKQVDVGDMVSPGQALFLLEIPAEPECARWWQNRLSQKCIRGRLCRFTLALGRSFEGTVRDMVRQADARTRTVTVKISLPATSDLLSGMAGDVEIETGRYEAIVVPTLAVRVVGQLHLVEVVSPDGRVHRRFVTLGKHHDGLVEVLSGVKAGEEVVVR